MFGISRRSASILIGLLATSPTLTADTPWDAAFGKGVRKQPPGEGESAERPATPVPSAPRPAKAPTHAVDHSQALADAESLVATFNAAHEAGATAFSSMRSIQQVVGALAVGIPGGGRYASTVFRVPGLDPARQAAAEKHLGIERGRIVVRRPGARPAATRSAPADSRTPFAEGKLLVEVPRGFVSKLADNGDLVLSAAGATLTLHLEASTGGLDAWSEVRAAGERSDLPVRMSGKKVYLIEPDRSAPERVVVGFGQTLVSMAVDASAKGAELNPIRLALPKLIGSLAALSQ